MALFHLAYTVNFEDFHQRLKHEVVVTGKLDPMRLQRQAMALVETAGKDLRRNLLDLKYDESWLEDPDRDFSHVHYWYLIMLVSRLTPCPSLSNNRYVYSHLVLEKALPVVGWDKEEVRKLIFGRLIDDALETAGDQQLLPTSSYGGVLKPSDIATLFERLDHSRDTLLNNADALQTLGFIASVNAIPPVALLRNALLDALDMLATAADRRQWLYMVRDS